METIIQTAKYFKVNGFIMFDCDDLPIGEFLIDMSYCIAAVVPPPDFIGMSEG